MTVGGPGTWGRCDLLPLHLPRRLPWQCLILMGEFWSRGQKAARWLISSAVPARKPPRQQHLERPQQESSASRALAGGHVAGPECSLLTESQRTGLSHKKAVSASFCLVVSVTHHLPGQQQALAYSTPSPHWQRCGWSQPLEAGTEPLAEPATLRLSLLALGPSICLSVPSPVSLSVSFTSASVCPLSSLFMTPSFFLSVPKTSSFVLMTPMSEVPILQGFSSHSP